MREEVKVKRMGQFYDFQCYTILAESDRPAIQESTFNYFAERDDRHLFVRITLRGLGFKTSFDTKNSRIVQKL